MTTPQKTQKYQSDGPTMSSQAGKAGLPWMMTRSRRVSVNNSALRVDFSNHFKCENGNYFELIRDTFWFFKYVVSRVEVGITWIKEDHPAAPSGQKTIVSGPEPTPWWRTGSKKRRLMSTRISIFKKQSFFFTSVYQELALSSFFGHFY